MQTYNNIALLSNVGKMKIHKMDIPTPKEGELLIRITDAGICGSDLHYFRNGGLGSFKTELPMYMGHEPSGIVVNPNNIPGFSIGDRVAIEPGCPCLDSKWSLRGKHNLCDKGTFMGTNKTPGCFANFVCVNKIQVFKVPDSVDLSLACVCEPLAVALHTYKLCSTKITELIDGNVVIYGAGSIGLCHLIILKSQGIKNIFIVDDIKFRRDIAISLGAKHAFLWKDSVNKIKELTNNQGCELVIDCAGTLESFNSCVNISSINGTVALVGIPEVDFLNFNPHKARTKEISIINVRRSNQCLETCLKLLDENKYIAESCKKIITHKIPLKNIQEAFEIASEYKDCIKIVIKPEILTIDIKKIGFLGISKYGLEYLKHLVNDENFEVVYATSKVKKRGHSDLLENELQNICNDNNIPFLGNINVNNHVDKLSSYNADVVILGGYDGIIKDDFLCKGSKYGVINTHFGLIPKNRGCNPSMWGILENQTQGFTTYFCNNKIDSPEPNSIIDIFEINTEEERNTSEEVYNILCENAINRFPLVLNALKTGNYDMSKINLLKEVNKYENSKYHTKGQPNESYISWFWRCIFIQRFSDSQVFNPYPTIRTNVDENEIWFKVEKVVTLDDMDIIDVELFNNSKIGQVIYQNKNKIITRAIDGFVHCILEKSDCILLNKILESKGGKGIHGIPKLFSKLQLPVEKINKNIPIFDLKFDDDMVNTFCEKSRDILTSGRPLSNSKYVHEFEEKFSKLINAPYTIAVNSGTIALEIALRSINVSKKIVITPSNTFFATQNAVKNSGGIVKFVDIEDEYLQICPIELEKILSNHKKDEISAVIIVHIGGIISPNFAIIRNICKKYNVRLIEDAAHAHLSHSHGEYAGSIGDIAAFSFFPTKVMTAGEAGMITTHSKELYDIMCSIKEFGKQIHNGNPSRLVQIREDGGVNGKISELTGLLGSLECERVYNRIKKRNVLIDIYSEKLDKKWFKVVKQSDGLCSYYKCIVILLNSAKEKREELREFVKKKNINFTGEVYFKGVHEMPAYSNEKYNLPVTEYMCKNHVCPPLYPELTIEDIEYICNVMNSFLEKNIEK